MEPSLIDIFGNYKATEERKGTWFINFMNGSQNLYLLEGSERALLIDTGFGAGNLRDFVETLTDKPVLVANTHYHPDHSSGNGEFEEVMVHKDYVIDAPSVEASGLSPFDISKLPYPDYKKIIIKDGDIIDLGGREIEVIGIKQAHCNSSLMFYDRKERLLFVGDELECMQVLLYDNSHNPDAPYEVKERIENMKSNVEMIKSMADKIDMILPNHNGFPLDKSYLDDFSALADSIFDGTAVIEDKLNHPFIEMDPIAPELCRVRKNRASIFIKKAEVMKIYGAGL